MKSCVIVGNLCADKTDDQYPTVNYCDECFEVLSKANDDGKSQIVNETAFDICHGEKCEKCGISYEEENKNT